MKRSKLIICAALAAFLHLVHAESKCGYKACPKLDPSKLTVHLVPHTHDDVGWVKTVDQYFHGGSGGAFGTGVKSIIESVIGQLVLDPSRKFIWVETAFLWKWWASQTNDTKRDVFRKLVADGQLEITGGGWCMNDEAVTHYQSTIDQFTWGFRRISDIFGDCGRSRIGWQIDPFGHSRETASLMAHLGFDGMFFGRLDIDDKAHRMRTKTMEHIWRGSKNLGRESDLFTGVLYNTYSPPKGFCFDVWCSDFIDDDKNSSRYNADKKVADFMIQAKKQAESYKTKNILWTMGMDFHYMVAAKWYDNMDILIKHVNELSVKTGVTVVYSTPACYLQALHDANQTWSTKEDDFFPYASEPHTYWTGYFTSRPNLKRFEREGNNLLQVCKQMHVVGKLGETKNLISMREAMGVLQHHDAITGTEKQYVADDYVNILSDGIANCDMEVTNTLSTLIGNVDLEMERCPLLNISMCETSENYESFTVTVYNPLARKVGKFVRLPITGNVYEVIDISADAPVETQLVPLHKSVLKVPGRHSRANTELIFEAADLPPLGFKSFLVKETSGARSGARKMNLRSAPQAIHSISNEFVTVRLDPSTGILESVTVDGLDMQLSQNMFYYESAKAESKAVRLRASGAYIFRPNSTTLVNTFTQDDGPIPHTIYRGSLVQVIYQTFSPWVSQVIRLYKGQKHFEIEWLVGPIPTEKDQVGKEVISWFSTSEGSTNMTFVTDSNGREFLARKIDHRDSWPAKVLEPVAGNYYPVTTSISMQNERIKVAVLVDRAQAGGSVHDGSLELMVHRRLVHDDGYGVNEVLNETFALQGLVTRGRHVVLVGPVGGDFNERQRQLIQQEVVSEPVLYFSQIPTKLGSSKIKASYSALKRGLPARVNLLTLEPWKNGTILLRLEHILEKMDAPKNEAVEVELKDLFAMFSIKAVTEMNLGANQKLADAKRFEWKSGKEEEAKRNAPEKNLVQAAANFKVVLYPMQIRTFVLEIE